MWTYLIFSETGARENYWEKQRAIRRFYRLHEGLRHRRQGHTFGYAGKLWLSMFCSSKGVIDFQREWHAINYTSIQTHYFYLQTITEKRRKKGGRSGPWYIAPLLESITMHSYKDVQSNRMFLYCSVTMVTTSSHAVWVHCSEDLAEWRKIWQQKDKSGRKQKERTGKRKMASQTNTLVQKRTRKYWRK